MKLQKERSNTMKKIFKGLTIAFAMVGLLVLASCSKVSQSYADKINKAAEKGENISLVDVRKALGDDALDVTMLGSGVIIAVKGHSLKSEEDWEKLGNEIGDDDEIEVIAVTILANKATSAKYYKGAAKDMPSDLIDF